MYGASQVALVVKNPPANVGDVTDSGSIPGSGRSSGEGNGYPLQYSSLENARTEEPGSQWSIGSQSQTQTTEPTCSRMLSTGNTLSKCHTHACAHTHSTTPVSV